MRHSEFARKLCAGENDFDNVHAVFRDGSTYAIPELLTMDLKARLQGERPARLPKAPTQAQKKKDRQREGLEGTVQAGELSGAEVRILTRPQKRRAPIISMMVRLPDQKEKQLCQMTAVSVKHDMELAKKAMRMLV